MLNNSRSCADVEHKFRRASTWRSLNLCTVWHVGRALPQPDAHIDWAVFRMQVWPPYINSDIEMQRSILYGGMLYLLDKYVKDARLTDAFFAEYFCVSQLIHEGCEVIRSRDAQAHAACSDELISGLYEGTCLCWPVVTTMASITR